MQANEFESIVTVNVTILLVLTTLFISVSNSLPKTAYIKMIDTFLIFSLFMPFIEVLIHTALDKLRQVYLTINTSLFWLLMVLPLLNHST